MFRAGLILLALIAAIGLADELLMRSYGRGEQAAQAAAAVNSSADTDTLNDDDDGAGTAAPAAAVAPGDSAAATQTAQCTVVQPPRTLPGDLPEASGAAPSLRTPGIVWVENDSRGPEVFAVDEAGGQRGRVRVSGVQNVDWEDLAVQRCQGGTCLYIGDIGDNAAARNNVTVYRLHEPAPGDPATFPAEAFVATYPDGAHDAEAMFATPDGGLFILTKGETGSAALYRYPQPLQASTTVRLQKLVDFSAERMKRHDRFTGAASSPDGRWVAVRTLHAVAFYRAADLTAGRKGTPLVWDLTPLGEAQGEGIGFARGDTLVLTSEGGGKKKPGSISRIACRLPG